MKILKWYFQHTYFVWNENYWKCTTIWSATLHVLSAIFLNMEHLANYCLDTDGSHFLQCYIFYSKKIHWLFFLSMFIIVKILNKNLDLAWIEISCIFDWIRQILCKHCLSCCIFTTFFFFLQEDRDIQQLYVIRTAF